MVTASRAALINADRVRDTRCLLALHDAQVPNEAHKGTGRKRAAGEPEDEHLVARCVVEHEKRMGIDDLVDQALAEETAPQTVVRAGTNARVIVYHLPAGLADGCNALSDDDHVGRILGA